MPHSLAIAGRCRPALVEPPVAATTAAAFSSAARVTISRGRRSRRSRFITASPDFSHSWSRDSKAAGAPAEPGSARPMASETQAMVLAVNWPPAGAGRGAGDQLQFAQILVVPVAGGVLADAFEDIDDRHVLAAVAAGQDRAAVDEHRRHVEPAHRHHHARQALVAAGERDQRVVAVAAHGQFDRIGDDLAADQRGLHALMAHGDAVGHRDGGEFPRRAPGRGDAVLHRLGLTVQGDIAGRGLVPRRGHADQRLGDLFLGHAHGVEERPVGRALRPDRGVAGGQSGLVEGAVAGHGRLPGFDDGLSGGDITGARRGRTSGTGGAGGGMSGCVMKCHDSSWRLRLALTTTQCRPGPRSAAQSRPARSSRLVLDPGSSLRSVQGAKGGVGSCHEMSCLVMRCRPEPAVRREKTDRSGYTKNCAPGPPFRRRNCRNPPLFALNAVRRRPQIAKWHV